MAGKCALSLFQSGQRQRPERNRECGPQTATRLDFHGWPDLQLRCAECWLWGQKYGRIDGDVAIKGDTLTLSNGPVDTGFGRLTTNGVWVNALQGFEPR